MGLQDSTMAKPLVYLYFLCVVITSGELSSADTELINDTIETIVANESESVTEGIGGAVSNTETSHDPSPNIDTDHTDLPAPSTNTQVRGLAKGASFGPKAGNSTNLPDTCISMRAAYNVTLQNYKMIFSLVCGQCHAIPTNVVCMLQPKVSTCKKHEKNAMNIYNWLMADQYQSKCKRDYIRRCSRLARMHQFAEPNQCLKVKGENKSKTQDTSMSAGFLSQTTQKEGNSSVRVKNWMAMKEKKKNGKVTNQR